MAACLVEIVDLWLIEQFLAGMKQKKYAKKVASMPKRPKKDDSPTKVKK